MNAAAIQANPLISMESSDTYTIREIGLIRRVHGKSLFLYNDGFTAPSSRRFAKNTHLDLFFVCHSGEDGADDVGAEENGIADSEGGTV